MEFNSTDDQLLDNGNEGVEGTSDQPTGKVLFEGIAEESLLSGASGIGADGIVSLEGVSAEPSNRENGTVVFGNAEDPEEAGQLDQEGVSSSSEDEGQEINPAFYMAKLLKAKGDLGDDFELSEDIGLDDVRAALLAKHVEPALQAAKEQATRELSSKYSEEDLLYVQALRNGTPKEDIDIVERMRVIGSMDLESMTDAEKESAALSMYVLRGTPEKEARILIDAQKDNIDELVGTSISMHADGFNNWRNEQAQAEAAREQAELAKKQQALRQVNEVFKTKTVGGFKMSDDQVQALHSDLYETQETLEVDGKSYPVSAINKFLYQFQNDVSLQLEAYLRLKHSDQFFAAAKDSATLEIEKEMQEALSTRKIKSKPKHKKPGGESTGKPVPLARFGFSQDD